RVRLTPAPPFLHHASPTAPSTLSLHDALPIWAPMLGSFAHGGTRPQRAKCSSRRAVAAVAAGAAVAPAAAGPAGVSPEVLGPEEPVTGEPPPGVSAPEEPVPVVSAPGLLVLEVCGR